MLVRALDTGEMADLIKESRKRTEPTPDIDTRIHDAFSTHAMQPYWSAKIDAVDAITTPADTVIKLQTQVQQSQSQISQLTQEVSGLRAQLANAQAHSCLWTKCRGFFYPDTSTAKQHTCPAGGEHQTRGNSRALQQR